VAALKVSPSTIPHRWKDEYLKELHKRNKWQVPTENLRVGDLVVIKDYNLPSNEWRLGRIDSVFPGADGNVRVELCGSSRMSIDLSNDVEDNHRLPGSV